MIDFLCKLWPYLAGGLIGWLLAGWLARRFKHSEPPVEKIVEKQIDNPEHLALISKLENENKEIAGLKTKISGFQSSAAMSSVKTVDNPVHVKRIGELEAQINEFKSSINTTPLAAMSSTASTKTVDNPAHLKRISELEAEVSSLKSTPNATNPNNTVQSALSGSTSGMSKTVDNPEHIKRIKELEVQVSTLQQGPQIDLAAAKAAGFKLKDADDLTAIEGIGPKISDLIKSDGVKSFRQLADTPVSSIQGILDNAGPSYKIANPGTWPDQANLAANNRWDALGALQDVLVGGVYPNASSKNSNSNSDVSNINTLLSTPELSKPTDGADDNRSSIDKAAAKSAGFRIKAREGRDDFTVVEGIGPKINDLIHDDGIHTYAALGKTKVEAIQMILDRAGPSYKLAKPGTWPAQADMAASNKWEALKAWQDELDGGK